MLVAPRAELIAEAVFRPFGVGLYPLSPQESSPRLIQGLEQYLLGRRQLVQGSCTVVMH